MQDNEPTGIAGTGEEDTDRCRPGCAIGPQTPEQRTDCSYTIREDAAEKEQQYFGPITATSTLCNQDEIEIYEATQRFYASYGKALPHDYATGEVDPTAYCQLLRALRTGNPADFQAIPLGCRIASTGVPSETVYRAPSVGIDIARGQMLLTNPQAALAFDLEGVDSHQAQILAWSCPRPIDPPPLTPFPAAPKFNSAEEIGEIAENYWMAAARDIPFTQYGSNAVIAEAATNLSTFSDFRGPKSGGNVTPGTIFRGTLAGDLKGPYISQFLLQDIPYGAQRISQRIYTVQPGIDYLTTRDSWFNVQRGCLPTQKDACDLKPRYIRNGRDLGQYVHVDVLFQAYFNAALILLAPSAVRIEDRACQGRGLGNPVDPGNPYAANPSGTALPTEAGFGTFGPPHIATLVAEVATRALKAVWYQKWSVHRRLRPEEFGGRIHYNLDLGVKYPFHAAEYKKLRDGILKQVYSRYGSYLLPMAFPEGCPTHPAYGAGHATVAGACVTVLKAWFDETRTLASLGMTPMIPSITGDPETDGTTLLPYSANDAADLTVGGELNKLASNIALGRNFAGVHWRSDYTQSVRLGEMIAISILWDQACTYNESFKFSFTSFNGCTVEISKSGVLVDGTRILAGGCPECPPPAL